MRILLLTRYDRAGPSSRYRFYQFFPYLEQENFTVSVSPFFNKKYVDNLYSDNQTINFFNPLSAYLKRTCKLLFDNSYDLVWMEKEVLPWIPASIEKLLCKASVPYVIDYDDAIFHRYDQHNSFLVRAVLSNKINQIMSRSTAVIAGNQYIADYARRTGAKKIEILPTIVDTDVYTQRNIEGNRNFTIGWIGSPSTSRHVNVAAPALKQVSQNNDVQFSAIGALEKDVTEIPGKLIPWQEETEVQELNSFDVGIMPLPDTSWEKGKCGFKLIQYMACGLPVIASPVGVNKEIVEHGVNGFLAGDTEEWIQYLEALKEDSDLCQKMGAAGRKKVEREYSLKKMAPRIVELLKEVVEG